MSEPRTWADIGKLPATKEFQDGIRIGASLAAETVEARAAYYFTIGDDATAYMLRELVKTLRHERIDFPPNIGAIK